MAKIHTTEWTPAILKNPVLALAMDVNWMGIVQALKRYAHLSKSSAIIPYNKRILFGRNHMQDRNRDPISAFIVDAYNFNRKMSHGHDLGDDNSAGVDSLIFDAGLVGTRTSLYGVPFSLTEEFVSVYRMHSLLRDHIPLFDHQTGRQTENLDLGDVRNANAEKILRTHSLEDLWYSFGVIHPGALTLNNYPQTLQNLKVPYRKFPFVQAIDIATVDILRDRERGVPRYLRFRKLLGMPTLTSFNDFGLDAETTATLKQLYHGDLNQVDLLVGCLAESIRPEGFGFGETAFQIFTLMASRRLMADRFFSESYTEDVYTDLGLKWINDATMKSVLLRHMPGLAPALKDVEGGNAFRPWKGEILNDQAG
jgi:hypothetical protein